RIAGSARGTSSTSARSPTSSTRANGSPYALPSTRTSKYPRLTVDVGAQHAAPLPSRRLSCGPLFPHARPPRHQLVVDPLGDLAEGVHRVDAAELHRGRRHTGDHRPAAILRDPAAARGAERTHALRTVASHPGEDHAEALRTEHLGHGAKQRAGRGADAPHRWLLVERD